MNGKKIACLVLVMIIAGFAYGTQIMQQKSSAMMSEQEVAAAECEEASAAAKKAQDQLEKRTAETTDVRQFLKAWSTPVGRFQSGQEAEQAVMSTLRKSSVLAISQKFEVRENKSSPLVPKSVLASLTVQDDFGKTLNWLGELERSIPVARVTSCRIKQGDGGRQINLEVHVEVPLINLEAELDDPAKKK